MKLGVNIFFGNRTNYIAKQIQHDCRSGWGDGYGNGSGQLDAIYERSNDEDRFAYYGYGDKGKDGYSSGNYCPHGGDSLQVSMILFHHAGVSQ
jgi:hypothetical protein